MTGYNVVKTELTDPGMYCFHGLNVYNLGPDDIKTEDKLRVAIGAARASGAHEISYHFVTTEDDHIPREVLLMEQILVHGMGISPIVMPAKVRGDMSLSDYGNFDAFCEHGANVEWVSRAKRQMIETGVEASVVNKNNFADSGLRDLIQQWYALYQRQGEGDPFFRDAFTERAHDLDSVYCCEEEGKPKERVGVYLTRDGHLIGGAICLVAEGGKKLSMSYTAADLSIRKREIAIMNALDYAVAAEAFEMGAELIGQGMDTNRFGHHLHMQIWRDKRSFEAIPHKTDEKDRGMRVVVPNLDFSVQYSGLPLFRENMVLYLQLHPDDLEGQVQEMRRIAHVELEREKQLIAKDVKKLMRSGISELRVDPWHKLPD